METMEPKIQPEEALKRARLLFGCYRKSDAADPETYVMAVSAMLAQFDRETAVMLKNIEVSARMKEHSDQMGMAGMNAAREDMRHQDERQDAAAQQGRANE